MQQTGLDYLKKIKMNFLKYNEMELFFFLRLIMGYIYN